MRQSQQQRSFWPAIAGFGLIGAVVLLGGTAIAGGESARPASRVLVKDVLEGRTNIFQAAQEGDTEALSFFIDDGTDLNAFDPSGETALHHAAYGGNVAAVQMLLLAGANPSIRDLAGKTPLDIAVAAGQTDAARVLSNPGTILASR